jgi:hypothetical protein
MRAPCRGGFIAPVAEKSLRGVLTVSKRAV